MQSRRRFLRTLSVAGAAGLAGWPEPAAAEPPPETTRVRITRISSLCAAPQYVAEDLLRVEGFTDIAYPPAVAGIESSAAVARGEADFTVTFAAPVMIPIDRGEPISVVAGVHVGCFELFASEPIRSIADLKGKSVAVPGLGSSPHVFLTSMVAHVGLDPAKDINWVLSPTVSPKQLFADGKIAAFLGFPPEPQELRARKVGRVIVNSAVDRPWSQYFCCVLAGNREFVRKHPTATKRVTRAILKAADLCLSEPARSARRMVDRGFADRYDYALQTLTDVPYDKWREYEPEDTMRFYALRLRETGMIKSSPQKIIADGADWRFLNELKRELRG